MIVKVALSGANRAFDQPFDYHVPHELKKKMQVGQIVAVPFGHRKKATPGYVVAIQEQSDEAENSQDKKSELKAIESLLTKTPVVTAEQLRLAVEMRKRYFCSFSQALDTMLPPRISMKGGVKTRYARLIDRAVVLEMLETDAFRSQGHIRVSELLIDQAGLPVAEIKAAADVTDSVIQTLVKNEVLEIFKVEEERKAPEVIPYEKVNAPALRPAQRNALEILEKACKKTSEGRLKEYLLHGVTGSGKTEVYLQLGEKLLAEGKSVMVLVPEIALTPQMEQRIRSRFGLDVAILHSRLTLTERYEAWQRIARGDAKIVVGARSAVFAPLKNIGLIVLDEEHEATYKSGIKPRYHAADIARLRCLMHDAVLLLGSATPSVESYQRTRDGRSTLLTLPERIGRAGRPTITLVDMKAVPRQGIQAIISEPLQDALTDAFSRDEQAMILINRRGHARLTICQSCGHVLTCGSCEVALISHLNVRSKVQSKRLLCHHCDRIYQKPAVCPSCNENALQEVGYGTQQVEDALNTLFPDVGVARMDQDTTVRRQSHAEILQRFASDEAKILLGTQMIAKGHDFPNVTVVGILSADQLLNGDDFRAAERGFSLILQAAGRAGRGSLPGHVYIQAYNTEDETLKQVIAHDYEAFFETDAAYRKRLDYPPYSHLGIVLFSGHKEDETKKAAERFFKLLQEAKARYGKYAGLTLLPVAKAPLSRLRNRYRYRLIVKGENRQLITEWLALVDDTMPTRLVSRAIDIDPYSML